MQDAGVHCELGAPLRRLQLVGVPHDFRRWGSERRLQPQGQGRLTKDENNNELGDWKICKAPSNRAKCTKCKANIEAGELRIELLHYWSLPGARVGKHDRYNLTNYGPTVIHSSGAAGDGRKYFIDVQRN